ncbi:MAG TPA: nickel-dependent lactate racemase [bacterium]|nr:nickel-dependent lactate racemase [bacterium]
MEFTLPYHQTSVPVHIEDNRCAGIIYPNHVDPPAEKDVIQNALASVSGPMTLKDFTDDNDEILVIVNDATRPTPTARILSLLSPGLPLSRCRFLVATGSHRAPDTGELEWIFGPFLQEIRQNGRIHIHDARADHEMVHIGNTISGHPVHINRHVTNARKIMVITTVEPHYFGGYTGGRKSFLPGVTAYETIRLNHRLALQPESATLALDTNPVHTDMDSCLDLLSGKQIFAVQAVLDRHRRLVSAAAGDIRTSFHTAVEAAGRVFCVSIPEKVDIVVSVAPYPMDVDLYQSQKAMENAKPALKPGGIIVLVSSCRTGIGPETFYNLMAGCDSPAAVMNRIRGEYKLGYHKAAKMVEAAMMGEIWAVTDLDPAVLQDVFIRAFPSIQSAIDTALQQSGPDSKVLFIPEGSITVPHVSTAP